MHLRLSASCEYCISKVPGGQLSIYRLWKSAWISGFQCAFGQALHIPALGKGEGDNAGRDGQHVDRGDTRPGPLSEPAGAALIGLTSVSSTASTPDHNLGRHKRETPPRPAWPWLRASEWRPHSPGANRPDKRRRGTNSRPRHGAASGSEQVQTADLTWGAECLSCPLIDTTQAFSAPSDRPFIYQRWATAKAMMPGAMAMMKIAASRG